jgi:hypothetical protein
MPQEAEYKVIVGSGPDIQQQLNILAVQNWKPILMSSVGTTGPVAVTIVLEHKLGT